MREKSTIAKKIDMENQYRIIIAGGRDFKDYTLLESECDKFVTDIIGDKKVIIVSGGARGADSLGERYAREHGLQIKRFPADWNQFGRSAGIRRNVDMAQNADALIAFWNGYSHGTKHMIKTAIQRKINVKVVRY